MTPPPKWEYDPASSAAASLCSLHPCTGSFSLSRAACSWQRDCALGGHLWTYALKTSFGKQSLSCQPLLRWKRRSFPCQLIGRRSHLWQSRSRLGVRYLLRQGWRAAVSLRLPLFAGHGLALASVCFCQSRGEGSSLCSLSCLCLFQTFWCLVEQGARKSHC